MTLMLSLWPSCSARATSPSVRPAPLTPLPSSARLTPNGGVTARRADHDLPPGYGKREQRGNMLGIAQNPSTRTVSKGLLCLRVVILALLGALVLAGSAHAAGPDPAANAVSETPTSSESPTVSETPTSTQAPEVPPPAPVTGQAPEVPPPAPVTGQAPEVPPPAPVTGQAPEVPPPAPVTGQAPEVPPPAPVTPPAPGTERAPEVVLPAPSTEHAPEAATPAPGTEHAPEAPPPAPVTGQGPEGSQSPLPAAPQGEVPSVQLESLTGASAVGEPGGTSATSAGSLSCALSALEGRMTGNCTAGWLGNQRLLSAAPMGLATAAASLAAATGDAPGGGGHGGSAVGSPPVSSPPGPAPSGAAGGSAMGASGLALSGFLTRADLLLLGPPRAMRRLRLSCQPWLTACFVLIPERPG
jgi:hypothetical protein